LTKNLLPSGNTTKSERPASLRPLAFRASLLIMGASGIIAQIILLRELLVSFLGNELVLGIILANWLILEAAGAFLIGRTFGRRGRTFPAFLITQLLFSLALPAAIYCSRVFKTVVLQVPGEAVGFSAILVYSLLILLPAAVPHGALFTLGSKLYSLLQPADNTFRESAARGSTYQAYSISWVYVLESFGSILGGFALTFILVQRFDSFTITWGVSLSNGLISLILLWPKTRHRRGSLHGLLRILLGASLFLTLSYALLLFSPLGRSIHLSSIRTRWRDQELIDTENSIYGNITVTASDGQRTFFTDGVPAVTVPVPDIASIEDFAHFPMLLHHKPRSILIAGGGAGGMIQELLKYPIRRIEYVELDPLLLRLISRYGSALTRRELSDRRVEIHYTDARFFLTRTDSRYDLVFIGLGLPQELQTNRLFSQEFFTAAKEKLNPRGLVALSLPGSLTYLGEELRNLNSCLLDTLESVFAWVRVIPGEENLYVASDTPGLMQVSASDLAARFEEREIQTDLISPPYLEYRLQPQWLSAYKKAVDPIPQRINSDFRPLAVFYGLSYWNALYSPHLEGLFRRIEETRLSAIMILITVVTLVMSAVVAVRKRGMPLPYAIATTGFCGMVFDLAIIFTFQTLFGYLYYQIGLLVTVFMAGAALSSLLATRRLERRNSGTAAFLITELCLVVFASLLPLAFTIPSRSLHQPIVNLLLHALFLLMSFTSGVLTGYQFPLATRLHLGATSTAGANQSEKRGPGRASAGIERRNRVTGETAHTAGLLYGADLVGGYFGGLIGGVILLPILGLWNTCFILAAIKASSLVVNLLSTLYGTKQPLYR
jgi:spermidine synthase